MANVIRVFMEYACHYTDLNAVLNIIKPDRLQFRATKYNHLNGSLEHKWVYDRVKDDLAKEANLPFAEFEKLYQMYPYVVSFCNKRDDFLMWHLYGRSGNGIMLCLDKYSEELKSKIREMLDETQNDIYKYVDICESNCSF